MPEQLQITTSEITILVDALEVALLTAAKARSSDYGLFFQLIVLRDNPGSAVKELRDLLCVIQSTTALDLFKCAKQNTFLSQVNVDFRMLLQWLVSRGQHVGAKQAVYDLARYLKAETIEVTEILAIDGSSLTKISKLVVMNWLRGITCL